MPGILSRERGNIWKNPNRMKKLEECVRRFVRQENAKEAEGENIQGCYKSSSDVWGRSNNKKRVEVTEKKMLQYMCGVSKRDRISNTMIR